MKGAGEVKIPILQQDIARKAKVSQSTVSRVFCENKGIAGSTRKKVMRIARELGFRPNSFASALASGRSNNIGVAINKFEYMTNAYMGSIISGVAQLSDKNNKGLMFATSSHIGKKEPEYIRIARERRVDGLIIIDQLIKEQKLLKLSESGVPVVLIDNKDSRGVLPSVCVAYREIVREATSYLIGLGHRRIAVLMPDLGHFYEYKEKMAGYKKALERHGLPFRQELVSADLIKNLPAMVDSLASLADRPTAYICFNDQFVALVIAILSIKGIKIPQQASVISFDASAESNPPYPIGIVKFPGHKVGAGAYGMLVDWIGGDRSTKHILINAFLENMTNCIAPGK